MFVNKLKNSIIRAFQDLGNMDLGREGDRQPSLVRLYLTYLDLAIPKRNFPNSAKCSFFLLARSSTTAAFLLYLWGRAFHSMSPSTQFPFFQGSTTKVHVEMLPANKLRRIFPDFCSCLPQSTLQELVKYWAVGQRASNATFVDFSYHFSFSFFPLGPSTLLLESSFALVISTWISSHLSVFGPDNGRHGY